MSNILWVKTKRRTELLEEASKSPELARMNTSVLLEKALEEYVKKHAKSKNPQTMIAQFHQEGILAVPNVYEAIDNPSMWKKFYGAVKSKKEYKLIDSALMAVLALHNKKNREING